MIVNAILAIIYIGVYISNQNMVLDPYYSVFSSCFLNLLPRNEVNPFDVLNAISFTVNLQVDPI